MHHNLWISVSVFVSVGNCDTIFVFVSRDKYLYSNYPRKIRSEHYPYLFDRSGRKLSAPFSPLVSRAEILLYVFLQSIVLSCLYLQFCQLILFFFDSMFQRIPYLSFRWSMEVGLNWTEISQWNPPLLLSCLYWFFCFPFVNNACTYFTLVVILSLFFSIFVILQRFLTEVFVCPHSVKRT